MAGPVFAASSGCVKVTGGRGLNISFEAASDTKLLSPELLRMWQHAKLVSQP